MNKRLLPMFCLLLVAASLRVSAQELQVPFDADGKILVITKAIADQLGLYQEYPRLTEAVLFQSGNDSYVLEIRQDDDGRIVQQRIPMTTAEVLDLRARISALVAERKPTSVLDQSGRFRLLLGDFLLSYGFYGWALPMSLHVYDFTLSTGLYLVTSGAGFFVPFLLTRHAEVTRAQATLSVGLATLGILHGMAVCALIAGDTMDIQSFLAIPILTSVGEGVAGYFLAKPWGLSAPEADLVGFMGAVGAAEGALVSVLTGSTRREEATREVSGLSLAGSAGGIVLGKLMGDWTSVSSGDMLLIADTTFIGLMGAGCLLMIIEAYEELPLSGIILGGLTVGVTSGYLVQARKDFGSRKMNIVSLSMLGGALVGSGLGYLVFPEGSFTMPWLIPTMGLLGSGVAFGISLAVFNPPEESSAVASPALSLSVFPGSILRLQEGARERIRPTPGVQLTFRY